MDNRQQISLAVDNWSAWAPGIHDNPAWHAWAAGERPISNHDAPDVKFVAPMMRRRLSNHSRMAFRVAADCLEGQESPSTFVFCSRYGEYGRSFGILEGLARREAVSAAAFSMSVHNTAASLFAIETGDTSASTALASGEATMEAAFIEAWSLLTNEAATSVLLVYHDETLPDLYLEQATTVANDAAFAALLRLPGGSRTATGLTLKWSAGGESPAADVPAADPALEILRLLADGKGQYVLDTGRLVWTWSTDDATD